MHDIYINKNETIYISMADVKNFFDPTIYYDEEYNQIITTSDTKVANIVIDEKQMIINNSNVSILDAVIRINNEIYLPIGHNAHLTYFDDYHLMYIQRVDTKHHHMIIKHQKTHQKIHL